MNQASASEAQKLFPIWNKLKKMALASLTALQKAQAAAASLTVQCAKAKQHRLHVEHLIDRAGAHVEKVRATLLADYAERKKQLVAAIAKDRAMQAAHAQMVVETKTQQVAADQARLQAKATTIPTAAAKVHKLEDLLTTATASFN